MPCLAPSLRRSTSDSGQHSGIRHEPRVVAAVYALAGTMVVWLAWCYLAALLPLILPTLAPVGIACSFGAEATCGYAASRMPSTVAVRRRRSSLRWAAGTCPLWQNRGWRRFLSSSRPRQNRAADRTDPKPRMGEAGQGSCRDVAGMPAKGGSGFLRPRWSCSSPLVPVSADAVAHVLAHLGSDRARVAVVAIGRDPVRHDARHRLSGPEECLARRPVAALAEQHVHERAGAVDGAIDVAATPARI